MSTRVRISMARQRRAQRLGLRVVVPAEQIAVVTFVLGVLFASGARYTARLVEAFSNG